MPQRVTRPQTQIIKLYRHGIAAAISAPRLPTHRTHLHRTNSPPPPPLISTLALLPAADAASLWLAASQPAHPRTHAQDGAGTPPQPTRCSPSPLHTGRKKSSMLHFAEHCGFTSLTGYLAPVCHPLFMQRAEARPIRPSCASTTGRHRSRRRPAARCGSGAPAHHPAAAPPPAPLTRARPPPAAARAAAVARPPPPAHTPRPSPRTPPPPPERPCYTAAATTPTDLSYNTEQRARAAPPRRDTARRCTTTVPFYYALLLCAGSSYATRHPSAPCRLQRGGGGSCRPSLATQRGALGGQAPSGLASPRALPPLSTGAPGDSRGMVFTDRRPQRLLEVPRPHPGAAAQARGPVSGPRPDSGPGGVRLAALWAAARRCSRVVTLRGSPAPRRGQAPRGLRPRPILCPSLSA